MPIDETRYLTVAWEMWLRGDWFAPLTVNFEPYHHKPPLLFWLINASWAVFGVSRWAATLPVVLAALGATVLTGTLGKQLLPELSTRVQTVLLGSFGFLIYSTVILFDLTLAVFVLGALLCLLAYSKSRQLRFMLAMGLLLGLGVLTKGPVAYLYVLFPVLFAPYWAERKRGWKSWYYGNLLAFLVSLLPILVWLVPVLNASSNEFGYWLVWEQTAGRVTGSYRSSHARPVYFYLLLMPLMLVPWVFFGRFWKGFTAVKRGFSDQPGLRFLVIWVVPTFLAFSLIGGKQPHYMVPLLPGIAILVAYALRTFSARRLQAVTTVMLAGFIAAHLYFSATASHKYDIAPIAAFIDAHPDRPYAFVGRHYRGEFNFLARLETPVETARAEDLDEWFADNADGIAIIRYRKPEEVSNFEELMDRPYRGKRMGIFTGIPSEQLADR
jgi:4-amino-4-deoxy-L-arabinose transferase-like glycosyltransferase